MRAEKERERKQEGRTRIEVIKKDEIRGRKGEKKGRRRRGLSERKT